jgi:hypothetical protein
VAPIITMKKDTRGPRGERCRRCRARACDPSRYFSATLSSTWRCSSSPRVVYFGIREPSRLKPAASGRSRESQKATTPRAFTARAIAHLDANRQRLRRQQRPAYLFTWLEKPPMPPMPPEPPTPTLRALGHPGPVLFQNRLLAVR